MSEWVMQRVCAVETRPKIVRRLRRVSKHASHPTHREHLRGRDADPATDGARRVGVVTSDHLDRDARLDALGHGGDRLLARGVDDGDDAVELQAGLAGQDVLGGDLGLIRGDDQLRERQHAQALARVLARGCQPVVAVDGAGLGRVVVQRLGGAARDDDVVRALDQHGALRGAGSLGGQVHGDGHELVLG